MSQISLKSISGITSITTSTGVDNQLTLHTNNTTQAFKLDHVGNLHFSNHVNTTGISTASNFKTGTSDLHSLGLTAASADIDDFISVGSNIHLGNAGVVTATTFKGNLEGTTGTFSGNATCNDLNLAGDIIHTGDTNTRIKFAANDTVTVETDGAERVRIDSSGRLLLGTTTEGAADADDLTVSTSGNTGITIRSGTTHNGAIHFSDATSGGGEYVGQIDYDHNNNSLNFYADNDQCLRLLNDKSVSVSDKLVLENGTVFLNKHSVGVGTTTQAGRNAGVSTATGTIIYNAETEKVQVYANATWRNVGSLEPEYGTGFYSSLSAAQSAGLSHYWPGNSSTSLISGLQPDDRKGNPTFNNKENDGYGATYPFFHFGGQTGGDSPTGYRFTHSADWV